MTTQRRRGRISPNGEIRYEECGAVGYLHFDFYNGALSTAQCERLRAAYAHARRRPTRVIVLMGGPDFWCNGMHLHCIEAADSPADASWDNINLIDDLARDILTTDTHLTIAALQGNAAAGGVFLALAADRVLARSGIVLNPHYRNMGNLYGSGDRPHRRRRRRTHDAAPARPRSSACTGSPSRACSTRPAALEPRPLDRLGHAGPERRGRGARLPHLCVVATSLKSGAPVGFVASNVLYAYQYVLLRSAHAPAATVL